MPLLWIGKTEAGEWTLWRMTILDLSKNGFEQARELYADVRLGFLKKVRFRYPESGVVYREGAVLYFETVLATGQK